MLIRYPAWGSPRRLGVEGCVHTSPFILYPVSGHGYSRYSRYFEIAVSRRVEDASTGHRAMSGWDVGRPGGRRRAVLASRVSHVVLRTLLLAAGLRAVQAVGQ